MQYTFLVLIFLPSVYVSRETLWAYVFFVWLQLPPGVLLLQKFFCIS